jgi:hypothetical protein
MGGWGMMMPSAEADVGMSNAITKTNTLMGRILFFMWHLSEKRLGS